MSALAEASPSQHFSEAEKLDRLRLIRCENVGPVTFHKLLDFYGSAKAALDAIPALAAKGGKRSIKLCDASKAQAEYEAVHKHGARMIFHGEADYPPLLQHIPDAPAAISVIGNIACWQNPVVGIVGARNSSANAYALSKKLAQQLGQHKISIASGLARGIDTAAHTGSLESGTIAVIAGGIDHIYPPENETLYKQIAEQGAIIAEAPFSTAPQARHFPARNRIIAGMSDGLIVIEASEKSGSLITANYALDYGRDVFAVPGSPLDPRSKGGNKLIKQGATLTESVDDVLQVIQNKQLHIADSATSNFNTAPAAPISEKMLDEKREDVLSKLGPEPVLLDELVAQCHITPHILHRILLELELAGRLIRHSGARVSLIMELE
ncbi:MAG: DNA-processing protein DprA [Rickettsiales bacterium]|nr:DNA-processing protein DprA [Rickettsiales bacterium]